MLPNYFPKGRWPLPKKVRIIAELTSLPPVFLLSNGENIKGVLHNKKSNKRSRSRNRSRNIRRSRSHNRKKLTKI
jgi:hypothetical protein